MFKAAYILLNDEADAKDVVQDVFARLWTDGTPLREEGRRAFLLTCVRNRCLNLIARRSRINELSVKPEMAANAVATSEPAGQAAGGSSVYSLNTSFQDDEEIIQAVSNYIDHGLTAQTGRIIRMHFNEEQSYKDISSQLGISVSAVNKHIVQGLRKLRSTFKHQEL